MSEWRKPKPEHRVVDFLVQQPRALLYTSIVCFAEIRKGIDATADAALRHALADWLDGSLRPYFGDKSLDLSEDVVLAAIGLVDESARRRKNLSLVDVWIAATAKVHHLTVVTRNTKDMANASIPVLNPWTGERFNGA